ncbi:MAG: hypothetical protein OXG78_08670 [Chloroflexi bacterium]|nr:hypothetical protein [Chloroflexota bacterium]
MRKAMILCLLLFSFVPAIQSQYEVLPLCSADELKYLLDQQNNFDLLREHEPGVEESVDSLIFYHENQTILRFRMWWSLPACAEAVESAVLLTDTSSDVSAKAALAYAGVSLDENPYAQRQFAADNGRERVDRHFAEIRALIESGARPAEPAAGDRYIADCDLADLERLLAVMKEGEAVIEPGMKTLFRGQLLEYVTAMLPWRAGVWEQLRPCAEAIRYRSLMSQIANDVAIMFAMGIGGMTIYENPLDEQLWVDYTEMGVALRLLSEWIDKAKDAPMDLPFGTQLPACSADDMAAVAVWLSPLEDLAREALPFESLDDLLAYTDKFLDWRKDLWSDVPLCAQSVEISFVATHAASDFASMMALALLDEVDVGNPYREAALAGTARVKAWVEEKRTSGDASKATSQADSLPKCTASARDAARSLNNNLAKHNSTFGDIEYLEDLLLMSRVDMSLRGKSWREFTPCQEAIQAGRLLLQYMSDTVPAVVLWSMIGLPLEDIPYLDEMMSASEKIIAFGSAFGDS